MNRKTTWPAKLLLFGEYSILLGSQALSMPFSAFGAGFRFPGPDRPGFPEATESNRHLGELSDYLFASRDYFGAFIDLERFAADISNGIYLDSTIPQRYGMGSSGAVCAAVCGRYGPEPLLYADDLQGLSQLRERFVRMESFYHGKSSGFDPLVIYLQRPVWLDHRLEFVPVVLNNLESAENLHILLADSGVPCSTGPKVGQFLEQFFPGGKVTEPGERLISLVNSCIDNLLHGKAGDFGHAASLLSRFQWETLRHLIPLRLHPPWLEGLESGMFSLKLCGSGGGGFLVCFTTDKEGTEACFRNAGIPLIPLVPPGMAGFKGIG
ncbi:MAG: hypothetical protein WCO44_10550 [Bacteroidota bacterium]